MSSFRPLPSAPKSPGSEFNSRNNEQIVVESAGSDLAAAENFSGDEMARLWFGRKSSP